jgi:hypothetical protein
MLIRPKDKENLIQIFSEANIPFEVRRGGELMAVELMEQPTAVVI